MINKNPLFSKVVFSAAVSVLVLLPICIKEDGLYCRVLSMALFYGAVASAWNILALTGSVSLGHAAFFGLGAYGSALLSQQGISPYLSVFLGGLLGFFYAIGWDYSFGKLRGAPFALATLAAVEIPKVVIDNWYSLTSGSLGLFGIVPFPFIDFLNRSWNVSEDLRIQYYFMLLLGLIIGWVHRFAICSRWGWALRSTREEEIAASVLGVNVRKIRREALLLSAYITSLCGGIYSHLMGFVEPSLVFNVHISAMPLIISIFGGRYEVFGPMLGALILYPLDQVVFHPLLPVGHTVLYGLVLILTILFFPRGIGEWIHRRTGFV